MGPWMLRGDPQHGAMLVRDWDAGRRVLLAYRKFLRMQFRHLREHGPMRLVVRAVRFFVNDHPRMTVTVALVLAAVSWGLYFMLTR